MTCLGAHICMYGKVMATDRDPELVDHQIVWVVVVVLLTLQRERASGPPVTVPS
jgi:hypothetical protein